VQVINSDRNSKETDSMGSSGKQPQRDDQEQQVELQGNVPRVMVEQAEAAASNNGGSSSGQQNHHAGRDVPAISHHDSMDTTSSEMDVPPPAYGDVYGSIQDESGSGTKATMGEDGRVNIRIDQNARNLSHLLVPALRHQQETLSNQGPPPPAYIPPSLGGEEGVPPPPPMNVVIHVVGSRGDVQPFVALGKVLQETYGHRVRLATHPVFHKFVEENGLEFFSIGGDPSELMAFMVKNPGLMPGFDTMRNGDVGKRRKEIATMIRGCWRSCFETGNGTGPAASDQTTESYSNDGTSPSENSAKPFVADAIIANPPSFAHVHVAEKLGIPLHVMFTMPYSPTQAFPHPLANIQSSNADKNLTNYISYVLVEMLTWQGLGDLINRFRNKELGLEDINMLRAPGMLQRMRIPHTYCWSPALIPKPKDWGQHISISGFYFLNLATDYTPDPELKAFLDAGPPPVYIGFGSIVLDDPNAMTKTLFEAIEKTGHRALVSKGWGGMGADELGKPDNVFMLGNCPHDWLFKQVSAVVHHGGAGTTAAGITAGRPTLVVPFFGDQPFWGAMVHRAGAGPEPIPHKQLTADNLAEGIKVCLKPESQAKAHELAAKIAKERGSDVGAQSFHQFLDVDSLRCSLAPSRAAVWSIKRTDVRLSAMAACTLANENLLDFKELRLFRGREYEVDDGPLDPITGGATSIIGTASTMMMGFADMPIETLKALKIHPDATKKKPKPAKGGEQPAGSGDAASDKPSIERTDSSTDAGTPGKDLTPSTSRSGSTFNFQESLAKIQSPTSPGGRSGSMTGSLAAGQNDAERSRSPGQGRKPDEPKAPKDLRKHMETAMGSAEGVQRIVGAGFKSPMDFTMNLSKGFRNAPKLYGDDSVRKPEKVTDFKSGIRAAGREFGFGMYDGITGLVTQPMKGAQKEGAAGFFKGIGKGIGGIALKPGAAVFGIPGYTMQGVYKEMQKQMGSSVQNYIIAARTAQGYEEWSGASAEERSDVVRRWQVLEQQLRKKRNADDVVKEIFEEARRKRMEGLPQSGRSAGTGNQPAGTNTQQAPDPNALEAAIRESIRQTSRGNPEEDAAIERAIRVSMSELARQSGAARPQDDDDEALRKAMAASTQESTRQGGQEIERDDEFERALANSLKEQRSQYDHDDNDDNDEEYQQALRESQQAASNAGEGSSSAPAYDQGHLGGTTREQYEQAGAGKGEKSREEQDEERIVMEYVKKQSMLEQQHQSGKKAGGSSSAGAGEKSARDDDDDDEELRRAMEESLKDQKGA
jgi:UDP:flavonoid glycosyltransferase YjiC (YdhE family)